MKILGGMGPYTDCAGDCKGVIVRALAGRAFRARHMSDLGRPVRPPACSAKATVMAFRLLSAALAVASLLAGAAGAHEFKLGALTIGHPYMSETAPRGTTGAGYLSVANAGPDADRLLAVETAFPQAMLHVTETDAAGVSRMRHVEALEIPAGATLALEPRGAHVMFTGLEAPLKVGDKIPATLVFEHAGRVEVIFNVEPRAGGAAEGHDEHGALDGGAGPTGERPRRS